MKANSQNISIERNPLPIRSWKTQNQILCFQITQTILIIIVNIIIASTLMSYTNIYLTQFSKSLFEHETRRQVLANSWGQYRQTKQYFISGKQTLDCINELYLFISQFNVMSESATSCLFPSGNPLYKIKQFCYAVPIPSEERTDEQNFRQLNGLLNIYSPIFDLSRLTYCAYSGDSQIMFAYGVSLPSSYLPHDRPWYTNHMEALKHLNGTNQTTIISPPYLTFKSKRVQITQTMSLLQENGYFDGVVASNSDVPELPKKALEQAQPIIVNENGDLLTNLVNGVIATEIFKFYQTNYTGFTEENWEYLKSRSNEHRFALLKIFNAVKNKKVFISTIKLEDYYLFMFINEDYFGSQIQKIFENLEEFHNSMYILIIILSILVSFIAIIFQIIIIKYFLLQDFKELNNVAKNEIFKHQLSRTKLSLQREQHTSEIRELFRSYFKAAEKIMSSSANQKNETCISLEDITYPERYLFLLMDKEVINSIKNRSLSKYGRRIQIKLIIQCLKKVFSIKRIRRYF